MIDFGPFEKIWTFQYAAGLRGPGLGPVSQSSSQAQVRCVSAELDLRRVSTETETKTGFLVELETCLS